ncbi:MAG: hypothetical protein P4L41_07310 [Flavipsychrobacter sp.]|nr:hypothetical protein [Flavipsychrobacter sp.]
MNPLFKLLSCFTLLVCTHAAHAQDAQFCDFDNDSVDVVTRKHIRSSEFTIGTYPLHWSLKMEQFGDKYYMNYHILAFGKVDDLVPAGTKILTMLANDTIVTLNTDEDVVPSYNIEQDKTRTMISIWDVRALVNPDVMKLFGASLSEMARITIGNKEMNARIKRQQGQGIMTTANCMLDVD